MEKLTVDRVIDFEMDMGEAITDMVSCGNPTVFGGFLLGRLPEKSKEILSVVNSKYCDDFSNYQEEVFASDVEQAADDDGFREFMGHLVDFINLTEHTKKRVLELLNK